jgi:hypothetical protein
VLRSLSAGLTSIAVVAATAGCGSSGGSSPAQFSSKALGICTKIAPRVKATTVSVSSLNSAPGNSLTKLPQLASLLSELSAELGDLHSGLAGLTPPSSQKPAYDVFLADLKKLGDLTQTGAADLKGGTISGLQKFQALSAQLGAASTSLSTDGAKVQGLAACKNVGQ